MKCRAPRAGESLLATGFPYDLRVSREQPPGVLRALDHLTQGCALRSALDCASPPTEPSIATGSATSSPGTSRRALMVLEAGGWSPASETAPQTCARVAGSHQRQDHRIFWARCETRAPPEGRRFASHGCRSGTGSATSVCQGPSVMNALSRHARHLGLLLTAHWRADNADRPPTQRSCS